MNREKCYDKLAEIVTAVTEIEQVLQHDQEAEHPLVSDLKEQVERLKVDNARLVELIEQQDAEIADLQAEREAFGRQKPSVVKSPDWLDERCRELLRAVQADGITLLGFGGDIDQLAGLPNMGERLVAILEAEQKQTGAHLSSSERQELTELRTLFAGLQATNADAVRQERWDRFAAAALTGLLAEDSSVRWTDAAKDAVGYADAMLEVQP